MAAMLLLLQSLLLLPEGLATFSEINLHRMPQPRPKKEKAQRNYRIAREQKRRREERCLQRRQQLEILRARQQLLSNTTLTDAPSRDREASAQTSSTSRKRSLFDTNSPAASSAEQGSAAGGAPISALRSPLAARLNYRLVGGTWRRAEGQTKFVRLSGAELAAAVFSDLPKEEVAAAVEKAKRQDEGHMDLEAYDDSETQHTTLEGLS
ncbi:hypothetical protein cyc_00261 [Cyclospora cayetanensis]|uniref:BZIP domain-containing protein n=1 Tax=Cyclospora cayetanensis TaxID=88456 RepID=A0A1D3D064_9EIME|nr:hypothetical protein cyc_00261 [Cyclospora cayetanensis]